MLCTFLFELLSTYHQNIKTANTPFSTAKIGISRAIYLSFENRNTSLQNTAAIFSFLYVFKNFRTKLAHSALCLVIICWVKIASIFKPIVKIRERMNAFLKICYFRSITEFLKFWGFSYNIFSKSWFFCIRRLRHLSTINIRGNF